MASADWDDDKREAKLSNSKEAMAHLLRYGRRHTAEFLVVVGLVVVYILTQVLQPWLVKIVIDKDLIVKHPHFR